MVALDGKAENFSGKIGGGMEDAEHTLGSGQCSLTGQGEKGCKKEEKHD